MQSNRLQNRNLLTFHQFNKTNSVDSASQKIIDIPRWKKPLKKAVGIDSVKPLVSGMNNINLESTDLAKPEIRTLSLEVKLSNTNPEPKRKSVINSLKLGFGSDSYFEPEIQSFQYKLQRWMLVNSFVLISVLVLTASLTGVIFLIFKV